MESVLPAPSESRKADVTPTPIGGPECPWSVPGLVFAAACITFGILWDISWHSTIGRDTFWTPAHLMIYLGGTLGGTLGGWLAVSATFLRRKETEGHSIGILGARAPLGAWVAMWGAAAMLTSAPLDDWWHNAYGLDVKILSPPHALLAAGMYGVVTGAVLLAAAGRHRGGSPGQAPASGWVLMAMGIQLALASILLTEFSFPNRQHTGTFYLVSAAMYPAFLTAAARFAPARWSATRVALAYMAVVVLMVWILPLFPAEPGLAPVYNRVTHMTPPSFPLLLVVPALGLDLLSQGTRERRGWGWTLLKVILSAALFVVLWVPVQWFFAAFLISPSADNPVVAGHGRFLGYMARLGEWRAAFWRVNEDPFTPSTVATMTLIALVSCGLGTAAGAFLIRIRR